MDNEIEKLRKVLLEKEEDIQAYRFRLNELIRTCDHQWNESKYEPIKTKSYDITGVLTVSSDIKRVYDPYVSQGEVATWTRTCSICGLKQQTAKYTEIIKKVPEFNQ